MQHAVDTHDAKSARALDSTAAVDDATRGVAAGDVRSMRPESEAQDLGFLVKQIDMTLARGMNNSLRERDLTRSQLFMLQDISRHGGLASLKTLEADAGVAQSTSWGVARRLEEKGLISLEADPDDSRAKVACLTETGKAEADAGWRNARDIEERLERAFTEEERRRLVRYLERMHRVVESWVDEN